MSLLRKHVQIVVLIERTELPNIEDLEECIILLCPSRCLWSEQAFTILSKVLFFHCSSCCPNRNFIWRGVMWFWMSGSWVCNLKYWRSLQILKRSFKPCCNIPGVIFSFIHAVLSHFCLFLLRLKWSFLDFLVHLCHWENYKTFLYIFKNQ